MIAIDLFEQFYCVSIDSVALSSRWFHDFGDASAHFEEDLEYSLVYFKKNTEALLYAQAYSDMLQYNKKSHGGPILFKLICNETLTTK